MSFGNSIYIGNSIPLLVFSLQNFKWYLTHIPDLSIYRLKKRDYISPYHKSILSQFYDLSICKALFNVCRIFYFVWALKVFHLRKDTRTGSKIPTTLSLRQHVFMESVTISPRYHQGLAGAIK